MNRLYIFFILFSSAFLIISTTELHFKTDKNLRILNQCPDGYFDSAGACVKVCPIHQYASDGVCQPCSENCGLCLSADICNPCQDGSFFSDITASCVQKCTNGYFEDQSNRVCLKCSEGCLKCSSPDGLCIEEALTDDNTFDLLICLALFSLVIAVACLCGNGGQQDSLVDQEKQPIKLQAPEGTDNKKIILNIKCPKNYNILSEETENSQDACEPKGKIDLKTTKNTQDTQIELKLLTTIIERKQFVIDDGDDERAIFYESHLTVSGKSRSNSTSKKITPDIRGLHITRQISTNISETLGEELSPYLNARRGISNGYRSSVESFPLEFLRTFYKPSGENQKNGYKSDESQGVAEDNEETENPNLCSICSLNKRNCLNKPCQHVVACYSCMNSFKETDRVCPKCEALVTTIEKNERRSRQATVILKVR